MKLVCRICLFAFAITLLTFVMDSPAKAQGPWHWRGMAQYPFPGYTGFASPYSLGQIPVPPYFSLHPPVYYSMPVPRTYGYSPFAYPGSVRTPDVAIEEPEIIENPHVEESNASFENNTKTASYLIIDNPYVSDDLKQQLSTRYAAFEPKQ